MLAAILKTNFVCVQSIHFRKTEDSHFKNNIKIVISLEGNDKVIGLQFTHQIIFNLCYILHIIE